ncbi:hypothetical protein [Thermaerobacillus caldiproteolyticus]|uniref:Uncharacterized protein n=1 Tax=Thermaerobacillus caldiproteolyticus TaxID=247480 RepID=A0A7V9Z7R4_9BACL|nr:hypothetical protein [Anoxybacillus caldiproteolyticus]MBA2875622.1 hypothetical protein [Anoxybacillus caldiproteolyticus]
MSDKDCNRRNFFDYLLQWDNSTPVPKMQIFSTALGWHCLLFLAR